MSSDIIETKSRQFIRQTDEDFNATLSITVRTPR